jgi:hypothetical protein
VQAFLQSVREARIVSVCLSLPERGVNLFVAPKQDRQANIQANVGLTFEGLVSLVSHQHVFFSGVYVSFAVFFYYLMSQYPYVYGEILISCIA